MLGREAKPDIATNPFTILYETASSWTWNKQNNICWVPQCLTSDFVNKVFTLSISAPAHCLSVVASVSMAHPKPHGCLSSFYIPSTPSPLLSLPSSNADLFSPANTTSPFFTLLLFPPQGLTFNCAIYPQQVCQNPHHWARQISLECGIGRLRLSTARKKDGDG